LTIVWSTVSIVTNSLCVRSSLHDRHYGDGDFVNFGACAASALSRGIAARCATAAPLLSSNVLPITWPPIFRPFLSGWCSLFQVLTDKCDAGPKLLRYSATPASMRTYYILISPRSSAHIVNVFLDRSPQLASSLMTWTVGLMNKFWCARSPGPGSALAGRTGTLSDYRHA